MGNVFHYETPIGVIIIAESDDKITHLVFRGEEICEEKYER